MITSAIQQATEQTNCLFEHFIMSKQMAKEFEWKHQRIEWELLEQQHKEEREENRRRHKEKLQKTRPKESRQQQQMNTFYNSR
jgi:hypothetical protein